MEYNKICPVCGKEFNSQRKDAISCSAKCRVRASRERNKAFSIICIYCGKTFNFSDKSIKYCSDECRKEQRQKNVLKNVHKWNRNNSEIRKERNRNWYFNNKEKELERMKKWQAENPEYIKNYYRAIADEYNNKNGEELSVSQLLWALRGWSLSVKEKDNNCCIKCGSTENLEAHHIVPKSIDITKIFDEDNGITLCENCHRIDNKSVHRILGSKYTPEEFYNWIDL